MKRHFLLILLGVLLSPITARAQAIEVALRSVNGKYVVAENGGGAEVNANRNAIGTWEIFTLWDLNGGQLQGGDEINIQASNKMYIVAEGGGGQKVFANRASAADWEKFLIIKVHGVGGIGDGDEVALRANNGQYVVAEGGGGGEVRANRNALGSWETFEIVFNPWGSPARRLEIDLESDLGANHFMTTHGVMLGTGHIEATTRTKTLTWFGGFRGGVTIFLEDVNGKPIGSTDTEIFGVDGTLVGKSDRTDFWSFDIPSDVASKTIALHVAHTWEPQALQDQVAKAIATGKSIIDLIKDIKSIGGAK